MLDFMTLLSFIIDFAGRIIGILFYIWGIRAAHAKSAARAASLYRCFWLQLCLVAVMVIAQVIIVTFAFDLAAETIKLIPKGDIPQEM